MDHHAISAFADELQKIKEAGEMQGAVRAGRRPLSVDRYLERETESEGKPSDFVSPVEKAAAMSPDKMKALGLVGAGALGMHVGTQAKRDWQMGRAVRKQQGV